MASGQPLPIADWRSQVPHRPAIGNRKSGIFFVCCVVLAGACSGGTLGEWPGWRGLEREGRSDSAKAPTDWDATRNVRWKTPIPGQGHSSPIVVGDRVIVTTAYLTGRGETVKRAAGIAVLAATGLLALVAAAAAVRSIRRRLRLGRAISAAGACLLAAALVVVSAIVFWQYERGELSTERRMELWLFSSVAVSLCLALGAFGGRWVRLGAGLAALGFAALVVLGRPDPDYFHLAAPGR